MGVGVVFLTKVYLITHIVMKSNPFHFDFEIYAAIILFYQDTDNKM